MINLILRLMAVLALTASIASCASHPPAAARNLCKDCQERLLNSGEFTLPLFSRNTADAHSYPFVHVYLEGDGQPWQRSRWPPWRQRWWPATNPSSGRLTALRLMMLDPQPSIYLNRPCYGLDVMPANCTANLWTGGRYSSTIADTMQTALDNLRQSFPGKRWLLIGHSGGGSLAMLIAQGRNDVAGVITLAANLDTEAWMRNRFSLPLDQSLNPVLMPPLQAQIPRWHFATEDDAQVPAPLIAEAAKRDEYARFILLQGDHDCCWQEHWPRIPQEMAAQLKEPE